MCLCIPQWGIHQTITLFLLRAYVNKQAGNWQSRMYGSPIVCEHSALTDSHCRTAEICIGSHSSHAWKGESTAGVESALKRMPQRPHTRAFTCSAASVSERARAASGATRSRNSRRQRSRGSSRLHHSTVVTNPEVSEHACAASGATRNSGRQRSRGSSRLQYSRHQP